MALGLHDPLIKLLYLRHGLLLEHRRPLQDVVRSLGVLLVQLGGIWTSVSSGSGCGLQTATPILALLDQVALLG